jgi:hypothetical protein
MFSSAFFILALEAAFSQTDAFLLLVKTIDEGYPRSPPTRMWLRLSSLSVLS